MAPCGGAERRVPGFAGGRCGPPGLDRWADDAVVLPIEHSGLDVRGRPRSDGIGRGSVPACKSSRGSDPGFFAAVAASSAPEGSAADVSLSSLTSGLASRPRGRGCGSGARKGRHVCRIPSATLAPLAEANRRLVAQTVAHAESSAGRRWMWTSPSRRAGRRRPSPTWRASNPEASDSIERKRTNSELCRKAKAGSQRNQPVVEKIRHFWEFGIQHKTNPGTARQPDLIADPGTAAGV